MAAPSSGWILPNLCCVYLLMFSPNQNGGLVKCQQAEILLEESSGVAAVSGPAGGLIRLPCDVIPTEPDDTLSLVIWYKQGHETPVYSFDIRNEVIHWSNPGTLGGRAKFDAESQPAVLILEKLKAEDSGQYRCRVDFIKSPTKNSRLNLTVLLPPEKMLILTPTGEEVRDRTVGPYDEDTEVNLTCVAVGGRPTPRVSWWKSHFLLGNSESRSTITLRLSREDLGTELTCQAVTDPSMSPFSVTLKIDVNLKPLWVKMQGTRRPLVAGQLTEIVCQVVGARPKPSISWWKGGTRLRGARESISRDGNMTTSILSFVPTIDDAGRVLSCRSVQPALMDSSKEDGFKMDIQHTPMVKLELGSNLDGSNVVEGSDVYLDCRIRANPWLHHVYFTHNDVVVTPSAGVLVHNQSLVLQGVARAASGTYLCLARNQLGEGTSNPLKLDVKYKPQCRPEQPNVMRAARGETLEIHCTLDANPQESLTYRWWFNSSSHSRVELHPDKFFSANSLIPGERKKKGYIPYTINNTSSYGWIQCAGRNSVGEQIDPCLFHILPADKPSSLNSCEIFNMTSSALVLSCSAGHDGGIKQGFILEIYDMSTGHLLANVTNEIPTFVVSGLPDGSNLRANIYAYNGKGTSDVTTLHAQTLKLSLRRTEQSLVVVQLTPLLCWVSGAVLLCVCVLVCVLATKCGARRHGAGRRRRRDQEGNNEKKNSLDETASMPLAADSLDSLDKNPDLIPDGKTNDNTSNKSSTMDYNSVQPLISQINPSPDKFDRNISPSYSYNRFNYDVIPMSLNTTNSENQYIQVRPVDYRIRPQSHSNMGSVVNMGIYGQSNGIYGQNMGNYGTTGHNNMVRANSRVFDDWLSLRNTASLDAGSLIPSEFHTMPPHSEIYQNHPFQKSICTSSMQRLPLNNKADVKFDSKVNKMADTRFDRNVNMADATFASYINNMADARLDSRVYKMDAGTDSCDMSQLQLPMFSQDRHSRLQFRNDGDVLYNKRDIDGSFSHKMPLWSQRQSGFSNHLATEDGETDCQTVETKYETRT